METDFEFEGDVESDALLDNVSTLYYGHLMKVIPLLVGELSILKAYCQDEGGQYYRLQQLGERAKEITASFEELKSFKNGCSPRYKLLRFAGHELKNLLMVVLHNAELRLNGMYTEEEIDQRWGDLNSFTENTLNSLRRLYRNIRNVVSSKPLIDEDANLYLGGELFLEDLVPDLIKRYIVSLGYELSFDYRVKGTVFAQISEGDLSDALVEVLFNAVEALGKEGDIKVSLEIEGDFCKFEVEDNGSGISEVVRDQVFECGFTTKREGTGIGLHKVLYLISKAGGDVKVLENETGGTVVNMYVPIVAN